MLYLSKICPFPRNYHKQKEGATALIHFRTAKAAPAAQKTAQKCAYAFRPGAVQRCTNMQ